LVPGGGPQVSESALRVLWRPLRLKAEPAFRAAPIRLPKLTPHVIRHLHATERVALAAELAHGDRERQQALVAAVQHDCSGRAGTRSRSTTTPSRTPRRMSSCRLRTSIG